MIPPDKVTETGPLYCSNAGAARRCREQRVLLTIASEVLVFQATQKAFFVGNN